MGLLTTHSRFNDTLEGGGAEAKAQSFLEPQALIEAAFEHFPFLQWRPAFFHNSATDPDAQINLFFLNPSCQKKKKFRASKLAISKSNFPHSDVLKEVRNLVCFTPGDLSDPAEVEGNSLATADWVGHSVNQSFLN